LQTLAFSFRLGHSTVHNIVKETCAALWTALVKDYMEPLDEDSWRSVERQYYEKWNFPNCVGAIDGKHIVMQAPASSGSAYYNYKGTHSMVLMAVVDAHYNFLLIDVGSNGRNSDGGILNNSAFGQALANNQLTIPAPKLLPYSQRVVPHVLVGDEGFPLKPYLMRPYSGRGLPESKRIFNYRLSRARRCSENAFGILAQRWRIFRRPIHAHPDSVEIYVKACCVLHNMLMKKFPNYFCDSDIDYVVDNSQTGMRDIGRVGSNNSTQNALAIRDNFSEHFLTPEGSIPWQFSTVNRGL
jgi:hypothetical protein